MTTHLLLRRCCAPPAIAGVRRPDRRRSLNPPIIPNIWRRRTLILLSLSPIPTLIPAAAQPSPEDLKPYTDRAEGFELLVPESWTKVEKAGATALFEEKGKGSNNIGVVVNPVRLSSLRDFGSPEFVAEKLIQAERKKVKFSSEFEVWNSELFQRFEIENKLVLILQESTRAAEIVKVGERSNEDGIPVYEFEYVLDSTRGGIKRIFSAAFVASKKLYLLNISHSDPPESPLDDHTRFLLESVLRSFDTAH